MPFRSRFALIALLGSLAVATAAAQGPTPAPAIPGAPATSGALRTPAPRPAPTTVPRTPSLDRTVLLDRVVAIVDDEALTQYEVDDQKKTALTQMKSRNLTPPPADVLDKQVLDRPITERAVLHFAKENGVRVDDTQVERTIQRIAQD